jgi:hypothetical protein
MKQVMFTNKQSAEILTVKAHIEEHIQRMLQQPWASDYILPWDKVFLSGGAIASLIQGEQPKDWDFYFEDGVYMTAMKNHLTNSAREHIADVDQKYLEVLGDNGKMITAFAVTMKDTSSFITMISGSPEQIKASFDYVHCTPHYSLLDKKLYISPVQYAAAKNKVLTVNNAGMIKPYRESKFRERGYT